MARIPKIIKKDEDKSKERQIVAKNYKESDKKSK